MAKHECCGCRHMKGIEDETGRNFYFCMFSQSPCFLAEVGFCCECELGDVAEEIYQKMEE